MRLGCKIQDKNQDIFLWKARVSPVRYEQNYGIQEFSKVNDKQQLNFFNERPISYKMKIKDDINENNNIEHADCGVSKKVKLRFPLLLGWFFVTLEKIFSHL